VEGTEEALRSGCIIKKSANNVSWDKLSLIPLRSAP